MEDKQVSESGRGQRRREEHDSLGQLEERDQPQPRATADCALETWSEFKECSLSTSIIPLHKPDRQNIQPMLSLALRYNFPI